MNEDKDLSPKNLPKIRTMQSDAGIKKEESPSIFESVKIENEQVLKTEEIKPIQNEQSVKSPAQESVTLPEKEMSVFLSPKINELSRTPAPLPKNEAVNEPKRASQSLRTFSDDLSSALRKTQGSVISIMLQEEEKRNQNKPEKKKRDSSMIIISIGLITIAVGVLFFVLTEKNIPFITQEVSENNTENFLFPIQTDGIKKVSLDGKTSETVLLEIPRATVNQVGEITGIIFTKTFGQTNKVLSTGEFISFFEIEMPGELNRSLGSSFLYGLVAGEETSPFFILTSENFEKALSGMLLWEEKMPLEIYQFLEIKKEELGEENFVFEDSVLENKDVRVLNLKNNKKIFYLIYPDGTIFIATNEKIVGEITEKISIEKLK